MLTDLQALADDSSIQANDMDKEIARLEAMVSDVELQESRLLDLYLKSNSLSKAQYETKSLELVEQRHELRRKALALSDQRDRVVAKVLPGDDVQALCALVAVGLDKLTFEERRQIVRTYITGITATRERVEIAGRLPSLSTTVSIDSRANFYIASVPC